MVDINNMAQSAAFSISMRPDPKLPNEMCYCTAPTAT